MLIAFTLLAVVFYICFVRPTVNAQHLKASVERGEYDPLSGLFVPSHIRKFTKCVLHERSWNDLLKCQRRVTLYTPEKDGNTIHVDMKAGPFNLLRGPLTRWADGPF